MGSGYGEWALIELEALAPAPPVWDGRQILHSMHTSNNFDALRLLAALGVWLSHGMFLYDGQSPSFLAGTQSIGSACVLVFFCISGYVIQQSLQRNHDVRFFFSRRVARILPGLWAAAAFSVFVVGWLATTLDSAAYWHNSQVWTTFINYASARALAHELPGVFTHNHFAYSVNGALWTIKYELLLYVLLYVFARATHRHAGWAMAALLLALACLLLGRAWQVQIGWWGLQDLLVFGFAFFMGAGLNLLQAHRCRGSTLLALALLAWLATYGVAAIGAKTLLFVVAVALGTLALALRTPALRLRNDLSYGVYVYAFPIQQGVTQMAMQQQWPKLVCLGVSLLLVLLVAWLSWRYLEQPALRKVQRYSQRWRGRHATDAAPAGTQRAGTAH